MLYHLYQLSDQFSFLNVFRYQTFRSMAAFLLTLALVLVLQPRFIQWVKSRQVGQPIRNDGPQSHLSKQGTPTMGGLVVIVAVVFSTVLLADLRVLYVWVIMGLILAFALLGFIDDYKKVRGKNSKGLKAKTKLIWQCLISLLAVVLLLRFEPGFSTIVTVPFLKNVQLELGYWFLLFSMLVIVGCSNAVNLTDGLDGLVIGPIMTCSLAYGVFSYLSGNSNFASYLQIPYIPGCGELAVFAAAVVAGGLGFLWFNSFPAQIFMGDVGSLSLGAGIGALAIITKQELVLVLCGGIFVLEALSVIAQVLSFKLTGKRVFKMAPLHHHYELKGISEPKIIVRAWIISIVLAVLSIATLKLR